MTINYSAGCATCLAYFIEAIKEDFDIKLPDMQIYENFINLFHNFVRRILFSFLYNIDVEELIAQQDLLFKYKELRIDLTYYKRSADLKRQIRIGGHK